MHFQHEGHQQIYDYWMKKKGDRRAPSRKDIDPLDVHNLLPNLFMFDVLRDPLDFVMRLHGTRLVEMMGSDCTGKHFHEVYKGETAELLWDDYAKVVNGFEIVLAHHTIAWMEKDHIQYDRLLLPLSDDNETVNILLGCTFGS